MARYVALTAIAGYFYLWGHFSDWSLHTMLFYENDVKATAARLAVAAALLLAAAVTVTDQR